LKQTVPAQNSPSAPGPGYLISRLQKEIGRVGWSLPIKGFTIVLDVSATVQIAAALDYALCLEEKVSADFALTGQIALLAAGRAKAEIEFAGVEGLCDYNTRWDCYRRSDKL
jgi:hypothetical protein